MRVKISDLLLWQWKPTMTKYFESSLYFTIEDDEKIRSIMSVWKYHGYLRCRCIPPIKINHSNVEDFLLSDKAMKQFKTGKWMVWDGFHRIYAARRLGYKTIKAEFY